MYILSKYNKKLRYEEYAGVDPKTGAVGKCRREWNAKKFNTKKEADAFKKEHGFRGYSVVTSAYK